MILRAKSASETHLIWKCLQQKWFQWWSNIVDWLSYFSVFTTENMYLFRWWIVEQNTEFFLEHFLHIMSILGCKNMKHNNVDFFFVVFHKQKQNRFLKIGYSHCYTRFREPKTPWDLLLLWPLPLAERRIWTYKIGKSHCYAGYKEPNRQEICCFCGHYHWQNI